METKVFQALHKVIELPMMEEKLSIDWISFESLGLTMIFNYMLK